jgi:hypothetical protein
MSYSSFSFEFNLLVSDKNKLPFFKPISNQETRWERRKGLPLGTWAEPGESFIFCAICGKSRNIGVDLKGLTGQLV